MVLPETWQFLSTTTINAGAGTLPSQTQRNGEHNILYVTVRNVVTLRYGQYYRNFETRLIDTDMTA